jgi:2'-5' RNA ligase
MKPDRAETDADRLIRVFLAIPLDTTILNSIETIQQQLRPDMPEIRWAARDNLHLTLHFFGDITEENLEIAAKIVVSVGSLFSPFFLTFTGLGAFPSPDRAKVIWIGIKSAEVRKLHSLLQKHFALTGFPTDDRPFQPHITIGRSNRQAGHILSHQHHNVAGNMRVAKLTLYESRLQPSGAVHCPRHTVRLAEP